MSEVRVGRYEATQGNLPPVCMRCGAPATTHAAKTFFFQPGWMAQVPIPLVTSLAALAVRKKAKIVAPFCDRHKGHWLIHGLWLWCSLFIVPVFAFSLMLANDDRVLGFMLGMMLGFLVWVVIAVIAHETSIHANEKETTENSLTLVRVSEQFAQAVITSRQGRRGDDYPEALPGGPRGGGSEQYFDPKS